LRLSPKQIENLCQQLLQAAGASQENASLAAEIFRRATTKGIGHHDLSYLPARLKLLRSGRVNGTAQPQEIWKKGAMSVFDGKNGLGEACCHYAVRQALELAQAQGLGLCTVRHSNHFLAGIAYSEIISEAGLMGLVWSNTDASMSVPESTEMVIGNNPVSFGSPSEDHPFLMDICMAYASLGTLASLKDQSIPAHWGLNAQRQSAKTAQEILQGGVGSPIGNHKGFGLALMHEFLTAGLNGGEWGVEAPPLSGGLGVHSQTVLVLSLPFGIEDLKQRTKSLKSVIHDRSPNTRLPGDRASAYQKEVFAKGYELPPELEHNLKTWCEELNLRWEHLLEA